MLTHQVSDREQHHRPNSYSPGAAANGLVDAAAGAAANGFADAARETGILDAGLSISTHWKSHREKKKKMKISTHWVSDFQNIGSKYPGTCINFRKTSLKNTWELTKNDLY